ncbi:hypothetical protein [Kaistia nematophila]|uniref:DUF2163 domain-containing protein n=1 Tax=Kaistia nematophila TaxID=2994654 RepID=A0A9X3E4H1_9HYPH|nr:hypothetical protein [Kaistia nematophila]MCX5570622.1 hypothetical protein [Kaistia nematophila]
MRDVDPAELAAIQAGTVVARTLISLTVKDRLTGNPVPLGFWMDAGPGAFNVINPRTGATEARSFIGDALISVGEIPLISDISVREVEVVLAAIDGDVQEAVRTYDVRNAPIEIHRVYLDPVTMVQVAPARCRFLGQVDTAPIETAAEGGASTVAISCTSTTQELRRRNPDVGSHESQILRSASDDFERDAGVVGDWTLFWGRKQEKAGQR